MGPASTSPRALHGWALEASSCSFRSCRVETSVVRVLSWVKPCSASWDLRVVCAFLKKKAHPARCSPRASCYLEQVAGGSCLGVALSLRRKVPEYTPGFFIKKNSDISWGLEVVFLVMCAFFEEKSALIECSPRGSMFGLQRMQNSMVNARDSQFILVWTLDRWSSNSPTSSRR